MFLQLSKPDAIFAAKAVAVSAGLAGICYVASSKLGDLQVQPSCNSILVLTSKFPPLLYF